MPGGDDVTRTAGPPQSPGIRRVLMTADAVGGVWPYTLDLAAVLRARGIEVTVAVMGPEPGAAQRLDAERVCTLEARPFKLEWMNEPWDDVERAGEWLLDVERRVRPDVVHLNGYCHGSLPWRAPAVIVAHSCVCSWWRSVHGGDAPAEYDRYRREVSKGLSAVRLVIAPTAAMREALRREYAAAPEIRVIPNARAIGEAAARGTASLTSDEPPAKEPFVFAAGRLWDEAKNIESLCAIAAALPWPVYVAGHQTGPDGRCSATGYARYLGLLEPSAMRRWFGRAAIYALPARYEPFGLSVLEAAMAGCALVLGDIPSLRENWTGAAVFVPPDNRRALAGALRRLMDDPEACRRLGALAQGRARRFDMTTTAGSYLAAYRDAVMPALDVADAVRLGLDDRDLTIAPFSAGRSPVPTL